MGIKFDSFEINGTDVSEHNGVIDWSKIPGDFSAIRVGYGNTIDYRFVYNWANSKGRVDRTPYWYMDYYSNWYNPKSPVYGMSDADWGKKQAENCWNALKNDPAGIVFLDIESGGSSYSPPITTVWDRALTIAGAFLARIDQLSGKTNGIYASLGLLSNFYAKFRSRHLWVAWYPFRTYQPTADDILEMVRKNGWTGKVLMWQYASDGDLDDNGTKDGKTAGTQTNDLDLNGWIATEADYQALFNGVVIPDETPDDEVIVTPPTNTRVIQIKESTRTLTLRKKPLVSWLTQIRTYPAGTKFDCLEKVTVNGNTWQRVGIDQYIADTYDGIQYLK